MFCLNYAANEKRKDKNFYSAVLESDYNTPGSNQTFILLSNNAFNRANEIYPVLTGATAGPITKADKTRLTNLLRYHIITSYVDQVKALPVSENYYEFDTKSAVATNKICLKRDVLLRVIINGSKTLKTQYLTPLSI